MTPLIKRPYRPAAGLAAATAVAVLVTLGTLYHDQSGPGAFDRAVDGWLVAHTDQRAALWVADLGNGPVVLIMSLLIAGWFAWRRRPEVAALVVLTPIVATGLTEWLVKPAVHRTKGHYLAYPSGHETGVAAIALPVALVALGAGARWLLAAALAGIALCGLALVAADYHYATDVIGGLCVAASTTVGLALLIDACGVRLMARGCAMMNRR